MKRIAWIFYFIFCVQQMGFSQLQKAQIDPSGIPPLNQHYQDEYTFDVSTNPELWSKQKPGLTVSFATTDELYLRTEVPQLQSEKHAWESTGWKGERLNAQVLIWSPDTLHQVRFNVSDLLNAKQKVISKSNVNVNLVRYVVSNFPYGAKAESCGAGAADTAYLMPDRFETFDRFELPGKTVRPIWITFEIPAEAEAGSYTGTIDVMSEKHHQTLNIKINVQSQLLPKPEDWKFRLDLWQNPWAVAGYYNVEPWSDEHVALLKKHLKPYAEAGGTFITTYAVHSPWSDNSYMIEGGMIEWIKRANGSWNFDYKIFDQYVELCMGIGIDEAITVYTPVPWGYRFRYLDEATGNYVYETWDPETEVFKTNFSIFLTDLKSHLQKKGWFEKTYLGINENPLNITMAAAKVVKDHSKDWKITYAGDWHPELKSLLDDYSPIITTTPTLKEIQERKSKGLTTTYYVCCTPAKPNNFVFSPPVESTYIGWYTAAYGFDGFLRWAYDAWPEDPMRDARHTAWPAGDCFIVYPGGVSNIRFEKLREGIVDYEKIGIIRELAAKSKDKKVKNLVAQFEKHLATFVDNRETVKPPADANVMSNPASTVDRDYNKRQYIASELSEAVGKGKKMIDDLSNLLSE
jgi:hypothetical protein